MIELAKVLICGLNFKLLAHKFELSSGNGKRS